MADERFEKERFKADTLFGIWCDGKLGHIPKDEAIWWEGWQRLADWLNKGHEAAVQSHREAVGKIATKLIQIAGKVVRREYLPTLETCRTIRHAREHMLRFDKQHVDLALELKALADEIDPPVVAMKGGE